MKKSKYVVDINSNLNKSVNLLLQNGFLIIRGIVKKEEIFDYRRLIKTTFNNRSLLTGDLDLILKKEQLFRLIHNDYFLNVIKEILGETLRIYPNFTTRRNTYSPWHIDDAFTSQGNLDSSGNCKFYQASIFFQDNSKTFGGGLDVIPESHRIFKDTKLSNNIIMNQFLMLNKKKVSLTEMKAGDLIIWNGKLFHKSTPKISEPVQEKLSFMWTVSAENVKYKNLFNHFKKRSDIANRDYIYTYDERYKSILELKSIPHDLFKHFNGYYKLTLNHKEY